MYVNAIGLGCMGLTHASGLPTPKEEAVEILRKSHDMGYDIYDTAECYTGVNPDGSTAYNEEVVCEAVKPFRKYIILCTKFGVKHMGDHLEFDSSPETIRKSLEGSLKKLFFVFVIYINNITVNNRLSTIISAKLFYKYRENKRLIT